MITAAGDHLTGSRTLGGHRKPRILLFVLFVNQLRESASSCVSTSSERNHTGIYRQRQNFFFSFFPCSF